MQIKELDWLREHKNLLSEEELQELDDLKRFEQYYNGKTELSIIGYLSLLATLQDLYEKYSGKKLGEDLE